MSISGRRRAMMAAHTGNDWKDQYVRDGLLMWLDGEHTGPNGEWQAELDTWYDQSGNDRNWENHGAVPGLKSMTFDANATQYLMMNSSLKPSGVAYMEVVFEAAALPTYSSILMGFKSDSGNIFTAGGTLAFRVGSGNVKVSISKDTIYSASSTGWLNGEQKTTATDSTSWSAGYVRIGSYNSSNTYRFSGKIYAIRLYSRVLTDAETQRNQAADYARFQAPDPLDAIPEYYRSGSPSYLDGKIAQIPAGKRLIYITDTHWTGNQKHSTALIAYVRQQVSGIGPVLYGGDAFGNAASAEAALKLYSKYVIGSQQAFESEFVPCVGDHDNNTVNVSNIAAAFIPYADQAYMLTNPLSGRITQYEPSEQVAELASGVTASEIMAFFRTVYYMDFAALNLRVIVLNCGNGGNYGAMYDVFGTTGVDLLRLQIPFLVSALTSTPEGYNICVLGHKLSYGGAAPNAVCSIVSGFKRKGTSRPYPSGSGNANIEAWWPNNTSYDFSNAPDVGYVFGLGGHNHVDQIKVRSSSGWAVYDGESVLDQSAGEVPWITTATDAAANTESSGPTMTVGTVTEQCFDVVTVVSDGLVLTRFGAGANRRVYMSLGGSL